SRATCRSHQRRNFTLSRRFKATSISRSCDCAGKALNKQKGVASKTKTEMKAKVVALVLLGSVALVRGDQMIERVQRALKDQGFYYGEITGDTNTNLTAAIRRYQIRNGLDVSGELNSETLRLLGINSSASGQPAVRVSPSPSPSASDLREESPGVAPVPRQPFPNPTQDQQLYPSDPVASGA